MIHTLIIPDVHGRDFWKEAVKKILEDTNAHIVFLGDYTDGYPQDWDIEFDYLQHTVDNFKEILDLKKQNPDRITLIIGNHDCGYAIGDYICSSRMDICHRRELEKLFQDNKESFQLVYECDIAGKKFIFSHAGILKGWAELIWEKQMINNPKFNIVDALNNAWSVGDERIMNALGYYDYYRGIGGCPYGSPVWSDIRSWVNIKPDDTFGYNIVGHTQCQSQPIILDTIADLDCRRVFYINNKGEIKEYEIA